MVKLMLALTGVIILITGAVLGAAAVQQPSLDFLRIPAVESEMPRPLNTADCEAPAETAVNWRACDKSESTLRGPDESLAGAILDGADFSGSYLNGLNMANSSIEGLDLSLSILFLVNFTGARGTPIGNEANFYIYTCPDGSAAANYNGDVASACEWLPDGEASPPLEADSPQPEAEPTATPAPTLEADPAQPGAPPEETPASTPLSGGNDALSINGRLLDGQGAGIPGIIIGLDSGATAITDSEGLYTFVDLEPGVYTIFAPPSVDLVYDPPTRTVNIPPAAVEQLFVGSTPTPQAAP